MRHGVALVLVVAIACVPPADPRASPTGPGVVGTVVDVGDGDSLRVRMDGVSEEVRLIGINAPELDECWGLEARTDLDRVLGRRVTVELDEVERDQYGRLLAWVWDGGDLVNASLAAHGSALKYEVPPNTAHARAIRDAEEAARRDGVGMWSPSSCGDDVAAGLTIVRVDADPPGPDEDHLDGESVTIANRGTLPIDLSGFVLRDASTVHRFSFPTGVVLDPGTEVSVVTGCGADTAATLHWCSTAPVWNNGGDRALLLAPAGSIVAHFEYGP